MIPMRVNGADQQEIMFLLCRVHQLEIENLESQSLSLYRDFQIKKKDMVLSRQRHYRNLSDEIIKRQKGLLDGKYLTLNTHMRKFLAVCWQFFFLTESGE